jgi:hypothetical protein
MWQPSQESINERASLAGDDQIFSAAFRQSGIIRAGDYEHMFNLARTISKQPFPHREGVFIITCARSLGVIAADAITDNGMRLSDLEPAKGATEAAIAPWTFAEYLKIKFIQKINRHMEMLNAADDELLTRIKIKLRAATLPKGIGYASGRALRLEGSRNNQIISSIDLTIRIIVNLYQIARKSC